MADTKVSKCANPNCGAKFHRLGEGRLQVFPVDDPEAWGLPPETKQKSVWLCGICATYMYVRLDRRHHSVQVVHRAVHEQRAS